MKIKCWTCRQLNKDTTVTFEKSTGRYKCPIHDEVTPVVKCSCGFTHILNIGRNTLKLATICQSCYSAIYWKDNKPVSRKVVLIAGTVGGVKFKEKRLKILGAVRI